MKKKILVFLILSILSVLLLTAGSSKVKCLCTYNYHAYSQPWGILEIYRYEECEVLKTGDRWQQTILIKSYELFYGEVNRKIPSWAK